MPEGSGWQPLARPADLSGRDPFVAAPFTLLARAHAVSAAGDAMVMIALAGSLFFSIDPSQARWRVALYLLLTLAPFGVVAPLIGPAIDRARGGSKWVIVCTTVSRACIGLLMVRNMGSLWLFPLAFGMLVMGKGYQVAKSAYVPSTIVDETELVAANSKLAILGGLASALGGIPAAAAAHFGGASWAMVLAVVTFSGASTLCLRIPTQLVQPNGTSSVQAEHLSTDMEHVSTDRDTNAAHNASTQPSARPPGGLFLDASVMGLLRAMVGFLAFLLAFSIRSSGTGTVGYGAVVGATVLGGLIGAAAAPRVRRRMPAEQLLMAALVLSSAVGLLGAFLGGMLAAVIVVMGVGISAAGAKLAFDSLVQRSVVLVDKGRAFGQFEARFQILWVLGAFAPVLLPIPARVGFLALSVCTALGAVSYRLGLRPTEFARRVGAKAASMPAAFASGDKVLQEPSATPPSARLAALPLLDNPPSATDLGSPAANALPTPKAM